MEEIRERSESTLKLGELMRAFARVGSAASVCGRISVGLSLSVLDAVCVGSSATVGHSTRLGSGIRSVCLARLSLNGSHSRDVVYPCESKLGVAQACHCLALPTSVEACPLWKWDC
jgi:hypothetical protein